MKNMWLKELKCVGPGMYCSADISGSTAEWLSQKFRWRVNTNNNRYSSSTQGSHQDDEMSVQGRLYITKVFMQKQQLTIY